MDVTPSRSGTWQDAAVCATIGVLALAAGIAADAGGATTGSAGLVTAVVTAGGLLADRLGRGRPTVDAFELGLRIGYRRQMALRLLPITACGAWIIVAAAVVDGFDLAGPDAAELLPIVSAAVCWSVTERILARRIAPRADADDTALRDGIAARLRSGLPAPTSFGWRRGRQLVVLAFVGGFALLGLLLVVFGRDGGRGFGVLLLLLFGYLTVQAARPLTRDAAVGADARGLDLAFQGTVPWDELAAVGLRRQSFVLYLDILVEEGAHDWATRTVRRRLRRKRMTELPLMTVDAEPGELIAAIRAYRPDLLVLLPGPDGAPVAL